MSRNRTSSAYDPSINSNIDTIINPIWNQYTDVELLVTAQNLTAAYADFGPEIDVRGYSKLGVWIISDVNDSLNVNLQALAKHTSAGADEYDINEISIIPLWTAVTPDFKRYYEYNVGAVPFIQLQAIAGTVGATPGDLTISITKAYV